MLWMTQNGTMQGAGLDTMGQVGVTVVWKVEQEIGASVVMVETMVVV